MEVTAVAMEEVEEVTSEICIDSSAIAFSPKRMLITLSK
jgi:hypothetical protein